MAHSFVQAHASESEAFRVFAEDHPDNVILLVDTYDTIEGVSNAITVAHELSSRGVKLRAVRIDSGDLFALSVRARRMLDEAGLGGVEILASGGLNETRIAELVELGAPIDVYGVGTDLAVSMDRPAVDVVYKLVTYDGRPVAKRGAQKATRPGSKQVFRKGTPESDVLGLRAEELPGEPLLTVAWQEGRSLRALDTEAVRERVAQGLKDLPEGWRRPASPTVPPVPALSESLRELAERFGAAS
jgi:nicotinate phosphoribosyltransferase